MDDLWLASSVSLGSSEFDADARVEEGFTVCAVKSCVIFVMKSEWLTGVEPYSEVLTPVTRRFRPLAGSRVWKGGVRAEAERC